MTGSSSRVELTPATVRATAAKKKKFENLDETEKTREASQRVISQAHLPGRIIGLAGHSRIHEIKNFFGPSQRRSAQSFLGLFSLRRGRWAAAKSAATAMHRLVGFNTPELAQPATVTYDEAGLHESLWTRSAIGRARRGADVGSGANSGHQLQFPGHPP